MEYRISALGSSALSRWATAKTRRSAFKAASIARSVPGRPAAMGAVSPGKITVPRSGSTGSVWRVAIVILVWVSGACEPADSIPYAANCAAQLAQPTGRHAVPCPLSYARGAVFATSDGPNGVVMLSGRHFVFSCRRASGTLRNRPRPEPTPRAGSDRPIFRRRVARARRPCALGEL